MNIGIYLDTSNSAAAALRDERPVFIPSAEGVSIGGKAFPIYVALTADGQILAGEPARSRDLCPNWPSAKNPAVCRDVLGRIRTVPNVGAATEQTRAREKLVDAEFHDEISHCLYDVSEQNWMMK